MDGFRIMEFKGISRTFSTVGEKQYEAIGEFWNEMSGIYGRENLRGLGYNWTEYLPPVNTAFLSDRPALTERNTPSAL